MKIMAIVGSIREGRAADKVVDWLKQGIAEYSEVELDLADLKDIPLPFFNEPVHPAVANGQYKSPEGTAWAKRVAEADGFIFITPEYNYGYPAQLKNAIDWVAQGWWGKPAAVISYGGISGGLRAAMQLRQVFVEIRIHQTHDAVAIPFIGKAFDDNGLPINEGLNQQREAMLKELVETTARVQKTKELLVAANQ